MIWPTNTKNAKLILGFEDMTIAAKWQTAFLEVVELLCKNKSEEQNLPSSPCDSPLPPHLHKNFDGDAGKGTQQGQDKEDATNSVFAMKPDSIKDSEFNEVMTPPLPLIIDRDTLEIQSSNLKFEDKLPFTESQHGLFILQILN